MKSQHLSVLRIRPYIEGRSSTDAIEYEKRLKAELAEHAKREAAKAPKKVDDFDDEDLPALLRRQAS